jgi:hypothetical protein
MEDCCPDCGFILEFYDPDDSTLDGCDNCKMIMEKSEKNS